MNQDDKILEVKKMVTRFGSGSLWERVSKVLKEHYSISLRPSVCRRIFFRIYYEKEDLIKNSANAKGEESGTGACDPDSDIDSDMSEDDDYDDTSDDD
jgi:hypothetical protein